NVEHPGPRAERANEHQGETGGDPPGWLRSEPVRGVVRTCDRLHGVSLLAFDDALTMRPSANTPVTAPVQPTLAVRPRRAHVLSLAISTAHYDARRGPFGRRVPLV